VEADVVVAAEGSGPVGQCGRAAVRVRRSVPAWCFWTSGRQADGSSGVFPASAPTQRLQGGRKFSRSGPRLGGPQPGQAQVRRARGRAKGLRSACPRPTSRQEIHAGCSLPIGSPPTKRFGVRVGHPGAGELALYPIERRGCYTKTGQEWDRHTAADEITRSEVLGIDTAHNVCGTTVMEFGGGPDASQSITASGTAPDDSTTESGHRFPDGRKRPPSPKPTAPRLCEPSRPGPFARSPTGGSGPCNRALERPQAGARCRATLAAVSKPKGG